MEENNIFKAQEKVSIYSHYIVFRKVVLRALHVRYIGESDQNLGQIFFMPEQDVQIFLGVLKIMS